MQPYTPHLSHHTALLRELLRESQVFSWDNTNTTFQKLKLLIPRACSILLQYYLKDTSINVQEDASKHSLGACLIQLANPIAFALKTLTDAKTWIANIKQELLVIVYASKSFHTYLYSHSFTVEMVHKHLKMTVLKM